MTEYTSNMVVQNLKPVVTLAATTATTLVVGDTLRVHGSFGDTNGDGPWQVAFVWGNGQTATATSTQGSTDSERVFTAAGVYHVYLKVTDKDGAAGKSAVIVVTVNP